MKELLPSEEQCLVFCRKSGRWLLDLYAQTGVFHISVSAGELLPDAIPTNVATSHIGVTVGDIHHINENTIPEEEQLRRCVEAARDHYFQLQPSEVLPLETFGPLPHFSTAFLAEFLGSDDRCLYSQSYAIAARRILYLVHSLILNEPRLQDTLHPYLLFRLARALVPMRATLAKSADTSTTFIELFNDDRLMQSSLLKSSLPGLNEDSISSMLGFGNAKFALDINTEIFNVMLQQIEWHAVNGASTELAWHSTPRKDRADPAALVFSIATLSFLNKDKHDWPAPGLDDTRLS